MAKLKLNEQLIDNMVKCIQRGSYPSRAAIECGISEAAYYDYLERAKHIIDNNNGIIDDTIEDNIYIQFYTKTKKADAVLEATLATKMMKNAMSSNNVVHQAIALERRYRDRWSPQIQVQDKNESLRLFKSIIDELKKPDDINVIDSTPTEPQLLTSADNSHSQSI